MSGTIVEAGKKISLRLMTNDDTDLIVKWRNNKRVSNNFVYRETFTRQTHENWIKTKVATGEVVQLIICARNFSHIPPFWSGTRPFRSPRFPPGTDPFPRKRSSSVPEGEAG